MTLRDYNVNSISTNGIPIVNLGGGGIIDGNLSLGNDGSGNKTLTVFGSTLGRYLKFSSTSGDQIIESVGAGLLLKSSSSLVLKTATNLPIYSDCGELFYWRDVDAGNANRMTLDSSSGLLNILGDVTLGSSASPPATERCLRLWSGLANPGKYIQLLTSSTWHSLTTNQPLMVSTLGNMLTWTGATYNCDFQIGGNLNIKDRSGNTTFCVNPQTSLVPIIVTSIENTSANPAVLELYRNKLSGMGDGDKSFRLLFSGQLAGLKMYHGGITGKQYLANTRSGELVLSASTSDNLVEVARVNGDGFDVVNSKPLRMGGTTIIDANRNATFDGLTNSGKTILTPGAPAVLNAATDYLTAAHIGLSFIRLSNMSNLVMASTPTIVAGVSGQEITILNVSPNYTVTLQDKSILTGSMLHLGATTRALRPGGVIKFIFDGSIWQEVSFSNNV